MAVAFSSSSRGSGGSWRILLKPFQLLLAVLIAVQVLVAFRLTSTTTTNLDDYSILATLPLVAIPPKKAPWRVLAKESAEHFVFEEVKEFLRNSGIPLKGNALIRERTVKDRLVDKHLCSKDKEACQREVEIYKCQSCVTNTGGSWYSAVTHAGAVTALVQHDLFEPVVVLDSIPDVTRWRFDIGIPLSGQDKLLMRFCHGLGETLKKLQWYHKDIEVDVRLLVTRYPKDNLHPQEESVFRTLLAKEAKLSAGADSVLFIPATPRPGSEIHFSRAQAGNLLHQHARRDRDNADEDCILAIMDVDMVLYPNFFRNARALITPGISLYMPIVWSEFNPESWKLVERLNNKTLPKFSHHRGTWRHFGFGIYAMAGSDARRVLYNESLFDGWGGEDNLFLKQATEEAKLHVIRRREKGLTHQWHPKLCDPSFVAASQVRSCVGSAAALEGSELGLHLWRLKDKDPEAFNALLNNKQHLPFATSSAQALPEAPIARAGDGNGDILIVVATCHKNFEARVGAIASTWAHPQQLQGRGITVWFAVGEGSQAGRVARRTDNSISIDSVFEMKGVVDDEYPPVRRNAAMIRLAYERSSSSSTNFAWLLKVDDDAYVNVQALREFVQSAGELQSKYVFFGQRGFGKDEDKVGIANAGYPGPFCMGGPGYLLNREAWQETAMGLEKCVEFAYDNSQRQYLWHSDVVIGMCVYRRTKSTCWDDHKVSLHNTMFDKYKSKQVFANQYDDEENFVKDQNLPVTLTMHPLKESGQMARQHQRFHSRKASDGILIVVTTTENDFVRRVSALHNTWAGHALPRDASVTVWYLLVISTTTIAKEDELEPITAELADRTRVPRDSLLVVRGASVDVSDPDLASTRAMFQFVGPRIDARGKYFDWILVVDERTFVNAPALAAFAASLDPTKHQVWGRRGRGRSPDGEAMLKAGLAKPYCAGSSGYLMSAVTFHKTAAGMHQCQAMVETSQYRSALWYSDVLAGFCAHKSAGVSCWDQRSDAETGNQLFLSPTADATDVVAGDGIGSTITYPFPEAFLY